MRAQPGTYALILQSSSNTTIQVSRWGQLELVPGYYVYVGSAFGPGGVRARVLRHCRQTKPKHWHIDYLCALLTPVGAWYSHATERLEHSWARLFLDMAMVSPVPRFGCSDCTCYSHLFVTTNQPHFPTFAPILGHQVETWLYQAA
jgi:Uri superfamily endonuclease